VPSSQRWLVSLIYTGNPDDLDKISLTKDGKIADRSCKLFAEEVLSNRKEAIQQEKIIENVKKSNQRNLSKRIDADKHIFDNNDPPVAKKPRKTNSDKKNSNQAKVPCTKVVKIKKSHSVSMASEKDKSTSVSNLFQERENLRK